MNNKGSRTGIKLKVNCNGKNHSHVMYWDTSRCDGGFILYHRVTCSLVQQGRHCHSVVPIKWRRRVPDSTGADGQRLPDVKYTCNFRSKNRKRGRKQWTIGNHFLEGAPGSREKATASSASGLPTPISRRLPRTVKQRGGIHSSNQSVIQIHSCHLAGRNRGEAWKSSAAEATGAAGWATQLPFAGMI